MMKQVMKRAWELARAGATKFGGKVKEYFASSLSIAWSEVKKSVKVNLSEAVPFETGSVKQQKWANDIRERIVIATNEQLLPVIEKEESASAEVEKAVSVYASIYNSIMNETSAKAIIDKYAHIRDKTDGLKIFPSPLVAADEIREAEYVLEAFFRRYR